MKTKYLLSLPILVILPTILSVSNLHAAAANTISKLGEPEASDPSLMAQLFDGIFNDGRSRRIDEAKQRKKQVEEVNSTIKSNRSYSKSIRQAVENEKNVEKIESDIVPTRQERDNNIQY